MQNRVLVGLMIALIGIDVVWATSGTEDVIRHEEIMPHARKDPDKYFQRFKSGEPDNEKRKLLFMVLSTLGQEKRLSNKQFLAVVEAGLMDLYAPIRNHAVHSIESVFKRDEAIKWLQRVTLDKSPSVRCQGVEALARYPSRKSLAYIDALLADPSLPVRGRAASTLSIWFQQSRYQPALDALKSAAKSDDLLRSGAAMSKLATNHGIKPDKKVMNRYVQYIIDQHPPYSHSDNVRHAMRILMKVMDQSSMDVFLAATKNAHPGVAQDAQEAIRILEQHGSPDAGDEPSAPERVKRSAPLEL